MNYLFIETERFYRAQHVWDNLEDYTIIGPIEYNSPKAALLEVLKLLGGSEWEYDFKRGFAKKYITLPGNKSNYISVVESPLSEAQLKEVYGFEYLSAEDIKRKDGKPNAVYSNSISLSFSKTEGGQVQTKSIIVNKKELALAEFLIKREHGYYLNEQNKNKG